MSTYKIAVRSNITNIVQTAIAIGRGVLRLLKSGRSGAIAVEWVAERCTIRSDLEAEQLARQQAQLCLLQRSRSRSLFWQMRSIALSRN
ncbi:hypothetical protein PN499_10730 [Kamptonema animale CS-326]|uniref:hypothetical protein n=1 Tax=Kamptonema animale TaxID=92934 RepID=UPI00232D596C|nr:hypothetical protein [Kamptonema animale]MDB9511658.1 hypothetical protein [Kamptonema animale CS-326]